MSKWGPIFFSPCNILLFSAFWFLILTFWAERGNLILPVLFGSCSAGLKYSTKKTWEKAKWLPSVWLRRRGVGSVEHLRFSDTTLLPRWYLASWEATVMSPSKRRHLITWQTSSFIGVHWTLLLRHSPCNLCADNTTFITRTWTTLCVWVSFFIECCQQQRCSH